MSEIRVARAMRSSGAATNDFTQVDEKDRDRQDLVEVLPVLARSLKI
jgi:hypothetical protein